MRHLFFVFITLSGVLANAALAGAADAKSYAPSISLDGVPSGKYTIDKSHVNAIFFVSHLGFSTYTGRFNAIDGTLFFDAADPKMSMVKVSVDTSSVDTNNTVLEEKLRGEKWFDTKAFKMASFTSTKVEKLSETRGKITGDFSLRGVSRPLSLEVTFNAGGENPFTSAQVLGFSAVGSFKRSDYGMKEYLPFVGDEVDLRIEAEFNQEK